MIEIANLATAAVAALAGEIAKGTAGPMRAWIGRRLGGKRVEGLAAAPDDAAATEALAKRLRVELEANPELAGELRALLAGDGATHAPQTASASGDGASIVQIQGESNSVNIR